MITASIRLLHDRMLYYVSNIKAVEDYEKKSNGNFITLVGILWICVAHWWYDPDKAKAGFVYKLPDGG